MCLTSQTLKQLIIQDKTITSGFLWTNYALSLSLSVKNTSRDDIQDLYPLKYYRK